MTVNDCSFTKLGKESIYNVIIIHMKGVPIKGEGWSKWAVNPPPPPPQYFARTSLLHC